ncbi:hypothetical protein GCM10022207_88740 [Streptomyces lannensis]|uniref:DNA-binding protein n=1 Tax=Streptomyces lannensis TaxID=766498 RepID=A0ABP7LNS1_9ACTN
MVCRPVIWRGRCRPGRPARRRWTAGPAALAGRDDGQAWAQWQMGLLEWGPVAFGCPLCTAQRGGGGQRAWVYRPRWQRVCAQHGRWLLDAGEGHPWQYVDIGALMSELTRAQRRWALLAHQPPKRPSAEVAVKHTEALPESAW